MQTLRISSGNLRPEDCEENKGKGSSVKEHMYVDSTSQRLYHSASYTGTCEGLKISCLLGLNCRGRVKGHTMSQKAYNVPEGFHILK